MLRIISMQLISGSWGRLSARECNGSLQSRLEVDPQQSSAQKSRPKKLMAGKKKHKKMVKTHQFFNYQFGVGKDNSSLRAIQWNFMNQSRFYMLLCCQTGT